MIQLQTSSDKKRMFHPKINHLKKIKSENKRKKGANEIWQVYKRLFINQNNLTLNPHTVGNMDLKLGIPEEKR